VRLIEQVPHSDPPTGEEREASREWIESRLAQWVQPVLSALLDRTRAGSGPAITLVGTGGTATVLGCMELELTRFDREALDALRLSRERARWHEARLWAMPLKERQHLPGLPPNRADVILAGVSIYRAAMDVFGFDEMRISTRGPRFGALADWAVNVPGI
jgi:exopolyphosphatase/guanosine-5'-triphosphate,3'-diphosphate pyrophosphatase